MSEEDALNIKKRYNQLCAAWNQRKKKCMDIVDMLTESMNDSGMNKKRADVFEELELDADESNGAILKYENKVYTVTEL